MGQLLGADPDELRELGGRMGSSADRVDHVMANITALLSTSRWEGGDGERFRSVWNGRLRGLLMAASASMRECGKTLLENVAQQEDASRGDGGTSRGKDDSAPLETVLGVVTVLSDLAGVASKVPDKLVAGLPKLVRGIAFDDVDVPKWASTAFDRVGFGLGLVSTALDVKKAFDAEPGTKDATTKWVDVAFDGAATVVGALEFVPFPPLELGAAIGLTVIDAAHLGYDIVQDHPELPGQIAQGAEKVTETVVSVVGNAGKTAVDAAESVISGGVHAVLGWL